MHVSVTVREPPLLEKLALGCSLQQGHSNTAPFYCWFSCDITAATLVVKNKSISLGTKLYFHLTSSRKLSTVLTPNMAKWLHSCKPRIPSKKEFYFSTKKTIKSPFFTFKCHLCELLTIPVAAIPKKLTREHCFLMTEEIEIS